MKKNVSYFQIKKGQKKMVDTEGLLLEIADAVISCKKDAVLAAVEKAKKVMDLLRSLTKGLSAG